VTVLSAGVAFAALFDDAAIFPPGNLPMPEAVRQHRGYTGNPTVGPFVCSPARLSELDDLLDASLDVSVAIPPGPFTLPTTRHARVVAVERHATAVGDAPPVTTYVESAALPTRVGDLSGIGRAKFRTGGVTAGAFPSEAALAAAIRAAVDAGVAFKCTAGLHHAVRNTGVEGFEQHGFLNVLLATHAALHDGDVEAVLAERDGAALADAVCVLPEAEIVRTRKVFCSFGTCSIAEPLADLRRLGLLS
jgi:hypothetical protein